jgi:nucleoside-diphosphate-sugar epimerase
MNPLYIDDMVECLKKSIGYKSMRNSSFTVSGNEIMSIRSISEYIGELCGVEPIFEQKHDMSENMIGDMLFQKELFTPKVSLKEGLSRVVNDVVKK